MESDQMAPDWVKVLPWWRELRFSGWSTEGAFQKEDGWLLPTTALDRTEIRNQWQVWIEHKQAVTLLSLFQTQNWLPGRGMAATSYIHYLPHTLPIGKCTDILEHNSYTKVLLFQWNTARLNGSQVSSNDPRIQDSTFSQDREFLCLSTQKMHKERKHA